MDHRLRVALFGAGGFGASHVACMEKLQAEGLIQFVAVADPAGEALRDVRVRLVGSGVRWFADFRELLAECAGRLDAVVISTPIPWHLPMLEAAMDAGLFVFLEKPPVPLIQDFLRVCERPEASRVAVGFKLLADPKLWRLKEAMVDGRFGRIVSIHAGGCWPRLDSYYQRASWAGRMMWREMPVFDGPATNALAHIVHNVMFLAGGSREGFGVPGEMRGEVYRARPIESYDVCCLEGTFLHGPTFAAAFTHAVERKVDWSIVVRGERGKAVLTKDGIVSDVPLDVVEGGDIFEECWRDFYRLATGVRPKALTGLSDCRGYVAATNAMLVSSGGVRNLPPSVAGRFERGQDGGWNVEGIIGRVETMVRAGRSFSASGAEWARAGQTVNADTLREISFSEYVPVPPESW